MKSKKSIWQMLSLSGAIGVIAYTAHVVIGGLLWKGYSHITQTISELTGSGAPNAGFLRIFTTVYGVLLIVFSFCLYYIFKEFKVHKAAKTGAVLLIIMEITSFFGYGLFPLDTTASLSGFQNAMHMAVTGIVVVSSIALIFFIAIGLLKTPAYKKLGTFAIIFAIIFLVSGAFTPIVMANKLPIAGLTERINIFTLQSFLFVLSVYFFKKQK